MGPGNKAKFAYDSIAERLKKANIYITGIGTQTHIENTHTGTPVNIRAFASKLKSIGMILQITELDIGLNWERKLLRRTMQRRDISIGSLWMFSSNPTTWKLL